MAFTQATLDVLAFYQKIALFPMPYTPNGNKKSLTLNPLHSTPRAIIFRYTAQFLVSVLATFSVYRIVWIYLYWSRFSQNDLEQLVVYCMLINGLVIYTAFSYSYQNNMTTILYTYNQMLHLQLQKPVPKSVANLISKLLVYGFSFGAVITLAIVPFAVFFISYCPVQLVFGASLTSKLIASTIYVILGLQVAPVVLYPIIIQLSFLEASTNYSAQLHISKNMQSNLAISAGFHENFRKYETLRILFVVYSKAGELMFTTMIFSGIILVSFAGFGTLQLYGKLHIFVYIPLSFLFALGIFMATVLNALAGIPSVNVRWFCKNWKRMVKTKLARRLLKSVPVIGFVIGPYGIATATLGLLICEDIVNNVLRLMLLKEI